LSEECNYLNKTLPPFLCQD